jgi:hypothetical protein
VSGRSPHGWGGVAARGAGKREDETPSAIARNEDVMAVPRGRCIELVRTRRAL